MIIISESRDLSLTRSNIGSLTSLQLSPQNDKQRRHTEWNFGGKLHIFRNQNGGT